MSKKNFFPKPKTDISLISPDGHEEIYTPSREALKVLEAAQKSFGLETVGEAFGKLLDIVAVKMARKKARKRPAPKVIRELTTNQADEK